MGMDLTGASLTTSEVRGITKSIEQISEDIKNTMKNVDDIMTIFTDQSDGGLIKKTTTAVKDLHELMDTLLKSTVHIALEIESYLGIMLSNDQDAKETLMKSLESNLYNNR